MHYGSSFLLVSYVYIASYWRFNVSDFLNFLCTAAYTAILTSSSGSCSQLHVRIYAYIAVRWIDFFFFLAATACVYIAVRDRKMQVIKLQIKSLSIYIWASWLTEIAVWLAGWLKLLALFLCGQLVGL